MTGTLISNIYKTFPRFALFSQTFSSIFTSPTIINPWNLTINRTIMRYHFPRPNERRRIKRHGWITRMSTLSGRKILMRRILKGKYVLSH
ncbi:39S ribosomal protein L34, mitochondrial [Apis dorsata]|uniref:39S ribosomal protein L34, mitochondrial n=1 Tax=Apis dorsata TaxID=7462 RepID=UPI0003DF6E1D|nr:39S ribosomal protein L34, mitochondrial [Apis dorsata]